MKKNFEIDYAKKTLTLSQSYAKKANNPANPEFDELLNMIARLQGFKIIQKEAKVKAGKKLTFIVMREHIKKIHGENSIMEKKFDKALELGKTHGSGKYLFVHKWFLENCPEYKPAALEAVDAAVDAEQQEETTAEATETNNVRKISA